MAWLLTLCSCEPLLSSKLYFTCFGLCIVKLPQTLPTKLHMYTAVCIAVLYGEQDAV